jgi:NADPH-dependent glutamate synthase beta subunit-like oxidoreductase
MHIFNNVETYANMRSIILAGAASSALVFAPCKNTCPVRWDAVGYTSLIAEGRWYPEALNLIRLTMPLAGVCGRVCLLFTKKGAEHA